MKNFLAPIVQNEIVKSVTTTTTKFCAEHQSILFTGGTIISSLATTAVTYRNAARINDVVINAREALAQCNTKNERNDVYKLFLKELIPLVAPIIIFQGTTIALIMFNKKRTDKIEARLAETAGALTIAQAAIAQYQSFQKEAETALGEERYAKLQDDIYNNIDVDGRRFTTLATEGAPGELLFIDKYSGRPFWCHESRIKFATERLSIALSEDNGSYDGVVSINDWYDEIQNPDLTRTELGDRFGYLAKVEKNGISYRLSDTHFIFPNGTRVQAAEVYLYPEPDYIG